MSDYDKILEHAWQLDIVDTHEHLPEEKDWRESTNDVFQEYLLHYFKIDVLSAGLTNKDLSEKVLNSDLPIGERWQVIEPYWHAARNTGYGRSLDLAAKELYGIDSINADTIKELNSLLGAAREKEESHFDFVLKEKSKIAVSIKDNNVDCDRRYFRSTYRLDRYINPNDGNLSFNDVKATCLDDWMRMAEQELEFALGKEIVCLKCGLAYARSLYYPTVPREKAEAEFNALLAASQYRQDTVVGRENLENFMMHHCLRLANERGLTYQFHTGIQEGTGNKLGNSDPEHMCNLFAMYPGVTFDIFHIGYPYQHKLGALAKMFPNVMIDMCWAHIISPEASVRALVEWLDVVPANKISAFGGDYCFIDGVYGHAVLARENVARALAEKVGNRCFDLERAKEICQWVFVDNPKAIFGLE